MSRLLDSVADLVTRHRAPSLVLMGALAAIAAASLPQLRADPAPEALVTHFPDERRAAARLLEHFGDTDNVVLLLLSDQGHAPGDALSREALQYQHDAALHFRDRAWVARVESLTTVPLVSTGTDAGEGVAPTLDELEQEPDLPPTSDELMDALGALVEAEPERFPLGLSSLADRLDQLSHGPLVTGTRVRDIDAARIRTALEESPMLEGRLVSADRTMGAVAVVLADGVDEHQEVAEAVRNIDAYRAAHPPPEDTVVLAAGLPHVRTALVDHMSRDQVVLVPLTLLLCMGLLYVSFRWWPAMVMPVVAVGLTALLVVGGMALLGEPLNVLNNIIPPLLIIIGISDSIHLLSRYREEIRAGHDRLTAARTTVRSMAAACLMTSLTTAVGLGSLVVSETPMLRRFAVTAAAGVMLAYVVTVVFLPPAITGFRPPRRIRDVHGRSRDRIEALVVGVTRRVLRHPWAVVACAVALLGASAYAVTLVQVDSALLDQFEEGDPIHDTTRLVEEKLDGIRPLEVVLHSDRAFALTDPGRLAAIDEATAWLRRQPTVLRATSGSDILHELWYTIADDPDVRETPFVSRAQVDGMARLLSERAPNPLHRYITADGRTARIEVRLEDVGARAILETIEALRIRLDRSIGQDGSIDIAMTGDGYHGSLGIASVTRDMLSSLALAVFIIFGTLTILFRSIRLGLLSILPNGLPLLVTTGWMVLRGIPLNVATAIIFSISLGLAVDGTIHVLARFREEQGAGRDVDTALLRAAAGTGRAIVVSSVSLMLGFSVLLLSSFVPVRYFAELIAVTVASCLLATLVLQPALLKLGVPDARKSDADTTDAPRSG